MRFLIYISNYTYVLWGDKAVFFFAFRLSSSIELMIFIETQLGMMNSQDTGSKSIRCVCVSVFVCVCGEALYLTHTCVHCKFFI